MSRSSAPHRALHRAAALVLLAGALFTGLIPGAAQAQTESNVPVVTISASATSIEEGAAVTITFTASPAPTEDLEVFYEIEGGSAFGLTGGEQDVTISADATSVMVVLQTTPDSVNNIDATVTVALATDVDAESEGYTAGSPNSVDVEVTQSDAPTVSVSAAPATILEGAEITVTFTADETLSADLVVKYRITGGQAFGLGQSSTTHSATIPSGGTSVAVVHDTDPDQLATGSDKTVSFGIRSSVTPAGADYLIDDVNRSAAVTVQQHSGPTMTYAGSFTEAAANDGTVTGSVTATLTGGTFAPASSGTTAAGVSASNVPAGLTAVLTRTHDRVVTLTLTGQATNHANANDVNNLTLTFTDAAFESVNAAAVSGLTKNDIAVDFTENPPTVRSVGISDPASGDTFRVGETVTVQVQYNSRLTVTGTPRLALTVGTATRYAAFSRVGNNIVGRGIVHFTYTVQVGDHDADGITIAGPIDLNGGTMQGRSDLAGAADLSLGTHALTTASANHKVDAQTNVTSIQVTSTPASGGTYRAGETIDLSVTLDTTAWVDRTGGRPRLKLTVGSTERYAAYESAIRQGGRTFLLFQYTVRAGDRDADGISIPADALDRNGAVLRDAASNGDALTLTLAYAGLADQSGHKVDGGPALAAPLAPDLSGVTVSVSGQTLGFQWVSQAADAARAAVTGYRVEWSADGNDPWTAITPNLDAPATPGTSLIVFSEGNVAAGTTRHYRVFALSASGDSPASATVSGTVPAGTEPPPPMGDLAPLAPTGLSAEADGETEITLRWTAPASDPARAAITGYEIEVSTDGGMTWRALPTLTGTSVLTFLHTGLPDGELRRYRVRATSAASADGAWSDEASAVTDVVSDGSLVDIPGADGVTVRVTTDSGVRIGTVHLEDGRTELTFTAAGSPLDEVTLTLLAGRTAVEAKRFDSLPDGAAEPPPGADAPETLLNAAVDLTVPTGSRVCLLAGAGAGAPRIYRFDGSAWERATIMNQRVEGGRACGTVTQTSPFAVFRERDAAAGQTAWIARFGRTVADQVIEAVDARSRAPRMAGTSLTLGGQPVALDGAADAGKDAEDAAAARNLATWLHRAEDPDERKRRELQGGGMTQRDFLLGSSFSLVAGDERSGYYALWGRGAVSSFDGREGDLTVDGEVASAFLGADWRRDRTTLGLILGHSVGDGGYASEAGSGTVSSTLTGLYPWMRHALSDRVSVWGVAGYGEGTLTLTPANDDGVSQAALRTDLSLAMGAVGLRGVLVEAPETGGVELAVKTDAMGVRTRSATFTGAGGNLAGTTAEVTRLRLGLEGSYAFHFEDGAALTPSLEVGVRLDGGDAETGVGLEVGGGIAWSDPARGLSVDLRGRGLLTHEDGGFRERGLSGSLVWDPAPDSDRGPSLTLSQTLGVSASDGGVDRLFREGAPAELVASGDGLDARSIQASFGYGFGVFGDRVTMTPEFDLGLSDTGRDYRLGWRLSRGSRAGETGPLELLLETTRREFANDNGAGTEPEHTVGFKIEASF